MTEVETVVGVPKFTLVVPTEEYDKQNEESHDVQTVELRELESLLVDMNRTTGDEGQSEEIMGQCSEVVLYTGEETNFTYKALGVVSCPECDDTRCRRPVRECCGHVKCRGCYISNADYCRQCQVQSSRGLQLQSLPEFNEHVNAAKELTPAKQKFCNNSKENASVSRATTEEIMIEPSENEYILELEQSSGGKSIALVSSATLKSLGLSGDDITENKTDEEDEEVNGTCNRKPDSIKSKVIPNQPNQSNESNQPLRRVRKKREEKSTSHIVISSADSTKQHCEKCSEDFEQEERYFRFHVYCDKKNGARPHICKFCGAELSTRSRYNYHIKQVHSGRKPLECNLCKAIFFQKLKLNRHMKVHEKDVCKIENESTEHGQIVTRTTEYTCAYCEKTFCNFSTCRKHLKTHLSEKPYSCDICGKSFQEKYTLQTHMQVHSTKRPYQCSRCHLAFTTAKDLRRHFLCHTGELPFNCGFCKQAFRRKDNMERHIRTTHRVSEKVTKLMGREAAYKYNQSLNTELCRKKENSDRAKTRQGKAKPAVLEVTKLVTVTRM